MKLTFCLLLLLGIMALLTLDSGGLWAWLPVWGEVQTFIWSRSSWGHRH